MTDKSQINWTVSASDYALIGEITARAAALARRLHVDYPQSTILMDLTACHANGCALDLERLLATDDSNLAHDVFGIRRHLNRDTGKLEGHFVPRLAARY
jgi:hypothetical protein